MEQGPQMREIMAQLELNEPIKWSFVIQTWETKILKAAFPEKKQHEKLRLESQKSPMKSRAEKLLNFLERPIALKKSLFENIGDDQIREAAQVRSLYQFKTDFL